MTFAAVVDTFLSGGYPVPMMVLIVVFGGMALLFFSKRMLNKLNIATKSDITQLEGKITQLRDETKNNIIHLEGKITQLRDDMNRGLLQLKENNLFHTNKAILLMARALISDEPTYGRIKDSIMENTTGHLRDDLRDV
jgi:muramoyltetrapeptide carboxypeptidase LdcA involved in peptidoglycan recycling